MTEPDLIPDLNDLGDGPSDGAIILKRAALGFGGGLVLVFLAGVIAGFSSAVIEHGGPGLGEGVILAAMLLTALLVAYGMWRFWPRGIDEPVAPRIRSARNILIGVSAIGLVTGFVAGVTGDGVENVFSNNPVTPELAGLAIALWLILFPVTWLWWRKIDEHEADAYRDGALVAAHTYLLVTPAWWMATRAGWLPAQDPMAVMLAVSCLWSAVWFFRRYM
jgi:hypothetical protein